MTRNGNSANVTSTSAEDEMDSDGRTQRQLDMTRAAYTDEPLHIPGARHKFEPRKRSWDNSDEPASYEKIFWFEHRIGNQSSQQL